MLGTEKQRQWGPGMSFVEKLQGINQDERMMEDNIGENDLSDDSLSDKDDYAPLCVISEDPARNFPTFSFSGKLKKHLYRAWKQAVIVKLIGRSIGYKLLLAILQKLWAKKGIINLINVGNGFFVVKFSNKDDCSNALTREDCKSKAKVSVSEPPVGECAINRSAEAKAMEDISKVTRKEKRTRDSAKGVGKRSEVLRLTNGEVGVLDDRVPLIKDKESLIVDYGSKGPGSGEGTGSMVAETQLEPLSLAQGGSMVVDDNCGDSIGTVVPETANQ
ncbi:hypothetical protein K1719_041572 [Acacia pycnantha]|nr:hypothetical protein K1719_041572 [Acacia pycnantha]